MNKIYSTETKGHTLLNDFSPKESVIQNLLNFSKSLEVVQSPTNFGEDKPTKGIEITLN
jgi:hypothetical protein